MSKKNKKIITTFKKKFTKRNVIVLIASLILVGGIYFFVSNRNKNNTPKARVERGEIAEKLILTGAVKADKHVKLYFPTSGKISWVGVNEGDWVKRGQGIMALDRTTLDAAYQQALNMTRKYGATVDNVHDQLKDKDSTETYSERDTRTTAEATNDYYYNALRIAEYNLRNAVLTSPFEGLVTYLAYKTPGVNVGLTEVQAEIVNPATVYFEVSADQSEVIGLVIGQEVEIILDSFPDKEYTGVISFISFTPMSGEAGSVYEVKISLKDVDFESENLRIGMTGDAEFIISKKEDALYVPPRFINSDTKGKFVYKSSKNNKVYVDVGVEGEDRTEIIGDVNEGDTLYD